MEKAIFDVPTLWADHHVLKVRTALGAVPGVEDVVASAAWKQVLVHYDPAKTSPAALAEALGAAGYPVGQGEQPLLVQPSRLHRDPQWGPQGTRITATNRVDLEMSGDFRRY